MITIIKINLSKNILLNQEKKDDNHYILYKYEYNAFAKWNFLEILKEKYFNIY